VADRKDQLEALRESWEKIGNRHLARYGFEPTLDRRSFEDRGIEQLPTVHLGKDVSALERDGVTTDRGDLNREIVAENERRVIDLAAARAMRDAQTAAQGRTDDTRPEPQQAVQEAAQRAEPEAKIETRAGAAEPSIAAHQPASTVSQEAEPAATAEPEPEILRAAGGIGRQILDAVTKPIANFIMALADIFSAPPPMTKQQVHEKAQAEGNVETIHAHDYAATVQAKEAEFDDRMHDLKTSQQQEDLSFSQRYGRPPTREAREGRERDDDYERERER
jgi:hypothetical protein